MKKKFFIVMLLSCCAAFYSFLTRQQASPQQKIKAYCTDKFHVLSQKISLLKTAVAAGENNKTIADKFLQARLAYKELEPLLEYYFEGDVKFFNGLAVPFIEEEDPTAHQVPQGFQVIESFIYPRYDSTKRNELLLYINKLERLSAGLAANPTLFNPQEYMPDALMEELYRVLTLGISGFDSPIAKISLPEAGAALGSIRSIMVIYRQEWQPLAPESYPSAVRLLNAAVAYLQTDADFDHFNRMEFISSFLNPLCDAVGKIKLKAGSKENPIHYSLIKRTGSLFAGGSLDIARYLYDGKMNTATTALGKKLFYEPLLSVNSKRSCGSCHLPAKAFTDGLPKALQLDGHSTLPRNTPTLWNAALQMNLFYDSRHVLPEDVIMEVLGNEQEMNRGAGEAVKKLQSSRIYQALFRKVFGNADTVVTENNAAHAIAAYVRTLISYNSRFDKYMRGEKDRMTATEIRGFNLFMGKAKCGTCHYTPLFNGSKPPGYYYQESEVLGVPATNDTLHALLDADPGRMAILKFDFFNHAFKTPTLRNIALTAPYMHNGVYKTLEEVIEFYNKGGGQGLGLAVPNQTLPADKLQLTGIEKKQLKAFLLTLTDTSAVH